MAIPAHGSANEHPEPIHFTGGRRTILCDNDPTFVPYHTAQRFGLPVVPEWGAWFNEEINRRGAIKPLIDGDTAATDYFKLKTSDKLATAFKPAVDKAMVNTGVERQFNKLMGSARALPFGKPDRLDINHYVVTKSLDGLFLVLGQEETKIRKDPAAQVTPLLKQVFGGLGR